MQSWLQPSRRRMHPTGVSAMTRGSARRTLHFRIRAWLMVGALLVCCDAYSQVTDLPPIKAPEKKSTAASAGPKHNPSRQSGAAKAGGKSVSTKPSVESDGQISAADLALIKKACYGKQYRGPAAYHECERQQAESARKSSAPSFEGVSAADQSLIEKACYGNQYRGPAAYHACQRQQIATAKKSSAPSFDSVSASDQALIEKTCYGKKYRGPAAYHACQSAQIRQIRKH